MSSEWRVAQRVPPRLPLPLPLFATPYSLFASIPMGDDMRAPPPAQGSKPASGRLGWLHAQLTLGADSAAVPCAAVVFPVRGELSLCADLSLDAPGWSRGSSMAGGNSAPICTTSPG